MSMIYIVEDDRNISEIESFSLKNSGYETAVFETARDFYEALTGRIPSLVLLDVMLPDEDGLHIVEKLRNDPLTQNIPVIMVTAKSTEMDKVRGLDIGADDYLSKPFGVMELISRVKALLRRSGDSREERRLTIGKILLDDERHAVYVNDRICELTHKEYELLKMLMFRAGIVTGRDEILDQVWGTDFQGESRTLDMHIKTLRQKLGEAGAMIRTVRNVGYILDHMTEEGI